MTRRIAPLVIALGAAAGTAWVLKKRQEERPEYDSGDEPPKTDIEAAEQVAGELVVRGLDVIAFGLEQVWMGVQPEGAGAVAKARSAIGHGITYELGAGQNTPRYYPLPTNTGKCDCTQFVRWVYGKARFCSSAWIVQDANTHQTEYRRILSPQPGCMVVYPGHAAILVDYESMTVVDCSKSHNGISEHVAAYFRPKLATGEAIYCLPV